MRTVRRVARMPGDARDSSVSRTRGSPGGDASVSVATPRRRISFESLSAAALAPSTVCQFGGHRTGIARGEKGSSNDIVGGYRRPSPAARLPRRRGFTRSASVSVVVVVIRREGREVDGLVRVHAGLRLDHRVGLLLLDALSGAAARGPGHQPPRLRSLPSPAHRWNEGQSMCEGEEALDSFELS